MSRGPEILRLAAKLGAHLRIDGDRIHWHATKGLDPFLRRVIVEHRAEVIDELRRRTAEEQTAVDTYVAREALAQAAAQIRVANGTAHPRDVHLAAGASIGEAERRARANDPPDQGA